jgi:hypothetical protein
VADAITILQPEFEFVALGMPDGAAWNNQR